MVGSCIQLSVLYYKCLSIFLNSMTCGLLSLLLPDIVFGLFCITTSLGASLKQFSTFLKNVSSPRYCTAHPSGSSTCMALDLEDL